MRRLFVIVHPDTVRDYAEMKLGNAKKVLATIERIKQRHPKECLEVNYDELHKLHPDMPPAAKDLKVFVVGAFGNGCAGNHAVWLEKAGYDVKMHWPALLNSSIDSIALIIYKEHEKLLKRP